MLTMKLVRLPLVSLGFAALAACGGGGSDPAPTPPPATTYTIGGSVAGLTGTGLVLQLNGANNLTVSANGAFTFPSSVASGAAYAVTVSTQPSGQTCSVASGSGTASANVTGVLVTCSSNTFTVRGNVTGLTGTGLTLRNNGGDNLAVTTSGAFAFATKVASGSPYEVTVFAQPSSPTQTCAVTSGATGTVANADVTNVVVTCTTSNFTVGGTVTGLVGTVAIRNTSGTVVSNLSVSANGTFTFPAQASGTPYSIQVITQPASQTCTVAGGTGTVTTANVTNVGISCSTTALYTVGGTVSNLLGTGLVLRNNGGSDLTVAAGATTFTFPTAVVSGTAYNVTVQTNPSTPAQTCTPTSNTGNIATANVTNISITCVSTDQVAPTVTTSSRLPQDTTVGTNLNTNVVVDFSEALMPSSVTTSTVTIVGPSGAVAGTPVLSNGNTRITVDPTAALAFDSTYTVTLTTGIKDVAGNALAQHVWTFNTGHRVATGGYHTCARLDGDNNGVVRCWGSNAFGQLGLGDTTNRGDGVGGPVDVTLAPVNVGTGRTVVDLVAGENHTCARLDNGDVKCWGFNAYGQLGLNDTDNRGDAGGEMGNALPAVFTAADNVVQIVAGIDYNCARMFNGTIKCWGSNEYAQIGQNTDNGTNPFYDQPQTVTLNAGLPAVKTLVSGGRFTCAQLTSNQIKCWGHNDWGQLGLGDTLLRGTVANPVTSYGLVNLGARTVKQMVATSGHACVLLDDDSVKCWGNNWFGQIARGVTNNGSVDRDCSNAEYCIGDAAGETPNLLSAISLGAGLTPVELGGGDRQTCVRFSNGKVKCWGDNEFGQLGQGDTATRGDDANEVANLAVVDLGTNYVAVELPAGGSNYHSCAVLSGGVVKCWGRNNKQSDNVLGAPVPTGGGQLGKGDTNARGDAVIEMGNNLTAIDLTP